MKSFARIAARSFSAKVHVTLSKKALANGGFCTVVKGRNFCGAINY